MRAILPDVLEPGLRVVFCGTAAGKRSAAVSAYYAGPGKNAARAALGRAVKYGRQRERLGPTRVFVLPSPSGAARGFWDVDHWRELASLV